MYPRQSPTTHTEQLGDEASVYDWARAHVHALNPTAARVWRQCDGATSPDAIAAVLRQEMGIAEADTVVDLTLRELARVHLLELPVESRGDRPATTRRWLLGRGVAAAMLPAIYSIVAPTPVDAQSLPAAAPTLTSVSPNQGSLGTTVAVTLTGTNFVIGATTVNVNSGGVTAANVIVSSRDDADRQHCDRRDGHARYPHGDGHDGPRDQRPANLHGRCGGANAGADADEHRAESRRPGQHRAGHTDGHQLCRRRHDGRCQRRRRDREQHRGRQRDVADSQHRDRSAAAAGARTVTVTTAGGTSGGQAFTITVPAPSAPTLASVAPNQGLQGATVAVTLTGTNFVVAATTVAVSGAGVNVNNIVVGSATSLTANIVIDPAAAAGARTVTVTTAGGTSGGQAFTISLPAPGAPTLTSVSPNQGTRGTTVAVTLTGTNFVVGATTVGVSGDGVTVTNVTVGSSTSLTANFVLDPAAVDGARLVTVATAAGTSGAQTFTINLPAPTLTAVSPNQGIQGTTVAVTLTGTNFVVSATTVTVSGAGVTVDNVVVGSTSR